MWEGRWAASQKYYFQGHVIGVTGSNPTPHLLAGEIYIFGQRPYYIPPQPLPTLQPRHTNIYFYTIQAPPTHYLAREPAHRHLCFPTGPVNPPTAGTVPEIRRWPTLAAPKSGKPPTGG
jgi:hypothetical protein